MEGILDMSRLLMELIGERLHQKPIPVYLLNMLSMVFNADANYHTKMKNKRCDNSKWNRVLGENNVFALMPHFQTHKDPKGWLVEIMNIVSVVFIFVAGTRTFYIKDALCSVCTAWWSSGNKRGHFEH
jgi:ribose 5-phosphate isomerase